MSEVFLKLKNRSYTSIVISDFTVNKKEKNVQGDVVNLMQNIGFDFVGTTVLLQETKPLYPFGYPYSYVINHHHQNRTEGHNFIESRNTSSGCVWFMDSSLRVDRSYV